MMNIVIIGAGDIGAYMATLLSKAQHNVIVVDKSKKKLDNLSSRIDVAVRVGSGTDWQLLDDLLELTPHFLIAVTDNDDTNLVACSIAKNLGYPATIARLRDSRYLNRTRLDFARIFYVDHFISPELLVANDIAKYIFMQGSIAVEHFAHGSVQLRTIIIPPKWKKEDKTLTELTLPEGVMIGLIKRSKGRSEDIIFPHGNDKLFPGDEVTFIGETEKMTELHRFLGIAEKSIKFVTIVGGSLTGVQLARILEKRDVSVKIVEKDYDRCVTLSEILPDTTILHHDGTDKEFLNEEKLNHSDVSVFCTSNDEVNILGGMLAKEIGAKDIVVMLSNLSYQTIVKNMGISSVVSPRVTAANRILSQILSGTVNSLISFYDNRAEVVEVKVSMDSKIVGIPLSELGPLLPKNFLIAMIQNRGRIMVANGTRIISPGDTVIVITDPAHVSEFEKIF